MKFKITFIALFAYLAIINVMCDDKKTNKYEQYVTGILSKMGLQPTHINECLDPEWRMDTSQDFILAETQFNNSKDTFVNCLLQGLSKEIEVSCTNIKEIVDHFTDLFKREGLNPKKFRFAEVALHNIRRRKSKSKNKIKRNKMKQSATSLDGNKIDQTRENKPETNKLANNTKNNNNNNNKKKSKFGPFDDYFPNLNKIKITIESISNTKLMEKTIKFLQCYKDAKDTTELGN